jgi:hypothetical protein
MILEQYSILSLLIDVTLFNFLFSFLFLLKGCQRRNADVPKQRIRRRDRRERSQSHARQLPGNNLTINHKKLFRCNGKLK